MDDQISNDPSVIRQTVAHIHTLTIEHGKRLTAIERHVRDIKFFVFAIMAAVVAIAFHQVSKG